jgi:xanthine dehydrogenase YagR molybdenum-binding subunit
MTAMSTKSIGKPVSRVDGPAKVTGAAKYAAEFNAPNLAHGFVVNSKIAKGRIKKIDRTAALAVPGVIEVFTHDNRPTMTSSPGKYADETAPPGSPFRPLYDDQILFARQPIALVVAEEFEVARFAATLVEIEYESEEAITDIDTQIGKAYEPPKKRFPGWDPGPRGNVDKAFTQSPVKVEHTYRTPIEHHNPMECFGTTAVWEDDGRLTIYDKTQGAPNCHRYVCRVFGLAKDKVRLLSPYVGGAFGIGLRPNYQLNLAVLAAIRLKRPVRVALTRQQMFTLGYRPETIQTLGLGAEEDGSLSAIRHDAIASTSRFEDYQEPTAIWTGALYHCRDAAATAKLTQIDLFTPCDMRAPGGASSLYCIESAMDELSYAAGIDPLELRLKNYSEWDQNEDKPFTSRH